MTEHAFSYFRDADWLSLVPVTTRSETQYRRLLFPDAFHVQYALICNGGKLLIQGEEDQEWSKETLEMVQDDLPELELMQGHLRELCKHEVYRAEIYYYYTKSDEPERICDILSRKNQKKNIRIEHDHRKVYLFPQHVNKGIAIQRFMKRYKTDVSVGAGDSIIDIPMLNEVNYPLAATAIYGSITCPEVRQLKGIVISDQVCEELEALHLNGII